MKNILIVLACLVSFSLFGQKIEVGGQIGYSNYAGDVNKNAFFLLKENQPCIGLQASYKVNPKLILSAHVYSGSISGDDRNFEDRSGWNNKIDFRSGMNELSLSVEWHPLNNRKLYFYNSEGKRKRHDKLEMGNRFTRDSLMVDKRDSFYIVENPENGLLKVYDHNGDYTIYKDGEIKREKYNRILSPYALIGIGVVRFDPVVNGLPQFAEEIVNGYPRTHLTVPFGGGLRYEITEHFAMALEGRYNYPFSDHIDGVSEFRNPDANDWYLIVGIKAMYQFGSAKEYYFD